MQSAVRQWCVWMCVGVTLATAGCRTGQARRDAASDEHAGQARAIGPRPAPSGPPLPSVPPPDWNDGPTIPLAPPAELPPLAPGLSEIPEPEPVPSAEPDQKPRFWKAWRKPFRKRSADDA